VENKRSVNFHRFDLGDAGGPIDSRVGDLCNHVDFTDVAAGGCLNKKTFGAIVLREKRAKTDLLYLKFNFLSLALGFESIGPRISAL
jgi:hypothetical protein